MRLSNKYGGLQFFAPTPEIHVMLLSVENYSAEHWGLYWIRINGESIDPNDDGLVAYIIKDGDIIQIPLSHPSTIVDGTTYDSGADAETVIAYQTDTNIEVSTSGPEISSAATVHSLKITVGGGEYNE